MLEFERLKLLLNLNWSAVNLALIKEYRRFDELIKATGALAIAINSSRSDADDGN